VDEYNISDCVCFSSKGVTVAEEPIESSCDPNKLGIVRI